jgi:hypothetical protein
LNYHNPAVKELIRKEVPRFVSFYKEFPDVPFYLYGGETGVGFITSGGVRTTGYGPSARAAFQAWLKKKYGDIGELNRKWEATYAGFKGIVQPKDPELLRGAERPKYGVTPLMADFASFVMDAHIEYMKLIYQTIKANDPLRPVMSYFGPPFWKGQDYRARMMEVCDILEFHASSNPVTLMNLYAYSQQRLHPEKGLSYALDLPG